jgi:tRNA dimethylallyltransferase
VLTQRITARVHDMIAAGLFEEVAAVESSGGFSRTAVQALGYKETLDALAGRIGNDEAIDMIITRTRQFAVRQERWFRRDPRVRWIDVEHDAAAEATPIVIDALTA